MQVTLTFDADPSILKQLLVSAKLIDAAAPKPAPAATNGSTHHQAETPAAAPVQPAPQAKSAPFTEAPPVNPVKKKGGRPTNAERAARQAAKEAAEAAAANGFAPPPPPAAEPISDPQPSVPPTVVVEPPAPASPFPPGVTAAPTPPPPSVAMPNVTPFPAPDNGSAVPLEVFRQAFLETNNRLPGKPFNIMKSTTWPDGSPKPSWFTADSVPPEARVTVMELWATMN